MPMCYVELCHASHQSLTASLLDTGRTFQVHGFTHSQITESCSDVYVGLAVHSEIDCEHARDLSVLSNRTLR